MEDLKEYSVSRKLILLPKDYFPLLKEDNNFPEVRILTFKLHSLDK